MKALIFDVDGTLAETEELHRIAFNQAFAAAGLDWSWDREAYTRLLTTTGGKERITRFMAESGIHVAGLDVAALHRDKTQAYAGLLAQGIMLRPGIAALMAGARDEGLKIAVATTTAAPNVEALARAAFGRPASQVFDAVAAGDMVAEKKPAPDVYNLALEMLGLAPQEAVAFEDSANGVRAARGAGLRVVLSPGLYTLHETDAGADLRLGCFSTLCGIADLRARLGLREAVARAV